MVTIFVNGEQKIMSLQEYNEYLNRKRGNIKVDEHGNFITQSMYFDENGKIKSYQQKDLDIVYINGQPFTGISYQGLMTVNTKTYVAEPTRANDGSIPNINDHDTFVVPRCKVNFKYFSLDDYMRLCEAIQPNEFVVDYYDKQFNTRVQHLMYCEPSEMDKLYNIGTSVIGVLDYEISFIGTLNQTKQFNVIYDKNGGSIQGLRGNYNSAEEYSKGDRVLWAQDNNYYEAIYEDLDFVGKDGKDGDNFSNDYWEKVSISEWSETAVYSKGSLVYTKYKEKETDQNYKYKYYEAIYDGTFSVWQVTNTAYWKSIGVQNYDDETTYKNGDYITQKKDGATTNTPEDYGFYKAIYRNISFTGKDPQNSGYWKILPILSPIKVNWGQSILLADQTELFDAPNDKPISANKWRIGSPNAKNFYVPNQPVNVFRDLTLYADWQTAENEG